MFVAIGSSQKCYILPDVYMKLLGLGRQSARVTASLRRVLSRSDSYRQIQQSISSNVQVSRKAIDSVEIGL